MYKMCKDEESPLLVKPCSIDNGKQDEETGSTTSVTTSVTTTSSIELSTDKPSKKYIAMVISYIMYSIVAGFSMAVLPLNKGWRRFSWHPLLMVFGVIGITGVALSTKKLGGYKNTKIHGMMMSAGLLMTYGGMYVIYQFKDSRGKNHFTTLHSVLGLVTLVGFTLSMLSGVIFLHPDIGISKEDEKKRFVHKWFARTIVLISWITCFVGFNHLTRHMTNNTTIMVIYAAPLVLLAPHTLL